MKVAVLNNRKPKSPSADVPDDAYEEFDSDETIDAIVAAIETLGISAVPVDIAPGFLEHLKSFDFVFNIAEGEGGRCREAIPAAVCELLNLRYTGSDPLTLAATLDKTIARRVVSPDVPVARAATTRDELADLSYPVIVKPNAEGSSKGIRRASFCLDRSAAQAQADWVSANYACPALVEEYLPGAEVTVGIAGNGRDVRVLGMMEVAPASSEGEPFVYSLEVKREFRRRVRYFSPPRLPEAMIAAIRGYALRAYELLGCRDIARIDFRLNSSGMPCFLECNPLPGLNPESSDLVIATSGTLSYTQLVSGILRDAAGRYGYAL